VYRLFDFLDFAGNEIQMPLDALACWAARAR
jgi:hypothetical protein